MLDILFPIVLIVWSIIVGILILGQPYLGVVFTAASLQVVDLLPSIPLFTSIVPIIGIVTIAGFLIQSQNREGKGSKKFGLVYWLGFLFIGWMVISNPQAAWFGRDRNWLFTFVQLWVLAFLAGELLDTPKKQRIFFWVFSIASALSAVIAITQGYTGENISIYLRASGLAGGANSAARYFVIGMIFFSFLRIYEKNKVLRLIAIVGVIVTFLGVFYTVSRTGILLLITAIGLMVFLNPQKKQNFVLIIIFLIAILTLTLLSDNISEIISSIIPSISKGTDTIGLRYTLWEAGWRMWLDHPLQGVGIGMFPVQLRNYTQDLPPIYYGLVTHNTYIQVLSETGIFGFGIFVAMIVTTLRNLWQNMQNSDPEIKRLQIVWFIVFLIMLLGGITMNESADKLIWLAMGVSEYLNHAQKIAAREKTTIYQNNEHTLRGMVAEK